MTPGPALAVISQHLSAWRQSFVEVFSFTEHQKKFSEIKRDTVHLWEGYCCCISCRHYISKAGIFWQATAGVLRCGWWVLGLQWSCEESNAPRFQFWHVSLEMPTDSPTTATGMLWPTHLKPLPIFPGDIYPFVNVWSSHSNNQYNTSLKWGVCHFRKTGLGATIDFTGNKTDTENKSIPTPENKV